MIYFVSGYMRSGTSMMMQALEAGGLDPVFNAQRDQSLDRQYSDEDYRGNPGGYYELTLQQYTQLGFPGMYEGRLIKCMIGGIVRLAAGDHRVLFMTRDPEEVRQSCMAIFHGKVPRIAGHRFSGETYTQAIADTIGILKMRRDVDLTICDYRTVVENPLATFESLRRNGWPIDPGQAAAVVDPKLYRYRLKNLEVGIV